MANMSYCRFQNTLTDLRDCAEALEDVGGVVEDIDGNERYAAKRLIELCRLIVTLVDGDQKLPEATCLKCGSGDDISFSDVEVES